MNMRSCVIVAAASFRRLGTLENLRQDAAATIRQERGAALIIAIVLMGIFGIIGSAYWAHLHATLASARGTAKAQAAHELAEAGIARALAELRAGNAAFAGAGPQALGGGTYRVSVTREKDGAWLLVSTGALGTATEPLHQRGIWARAHAVGGAFSLQYLPEAR